jgi:hypothetical protein
MVAMLKFVLLLDESNAAFGECSGAIGGGAVRALGGLVGDRVPVGFGVGGRASCLCPC